MKKLWKSFGDKIDIVPHDNDKRPRKIKTNILSVSLLIVLYIAGSVVFFQLRTENMFLRYLPAVLGCAAIIITCVFMLLKWKKNNGEFDIALLLFLAIFVYYTITTYSFI